MKEKVLAIEDSADIRELVRQTLTVRGYEVETAANGRQGVQKARTWNADVIICDIMMPYLNGYQVFKELFHLQIVPRTPFIFLTALDQKDDIRRGIVMGADDYLVKPFDINDLIDAVKTVLLRRKLLAQIYAHPEKTFDIFISYSHDDRPKMEQVRDSLETSRLSVWTDELIEPSEDWAEAIAGAIKSCGCVVALLSEQAANSIWVGRELGYAEANGTRIIPLLLTGAETTAIPFRLINHQFIDARTDFDEGILNLVQTIREHLGILPE